MFLTALPSSQTVIDNHPELSENFF